ncbi:MAG: hypothetical protein WBE26_15850 [Phycisphaerae bacterium]
METKQRSVMPRARRVHSGGAVASALIAAVALPLFVATGCSVRASTFEIVDYREPGKAKRYRETFDEGYYDLDEHGNVDVVLRRAAPGESDPKQTITQTIHIRSVWRSIPGETVAHRTQLNGTVSYHIVAGRIGATFDGAGSVFFNLNYRKDSLTGTLDLAVLRPKRQLATGSSLFKRAELKGEFHATRDPRRVVRIINEMDRLFGPLPPHQP